MRGYNSYEVRVNNPGKELLEFEYLNNNPTFKSSIWESYSVNKNISKSINRKIRSDELFKQRFEFCFKDFIAKEKTYSKKL